MTKNIIIGLALALGAIGSVLGFSHIPSSTGYGDTQTNPSWFSGGLAWGAIDLSHNSASIVIPPGSNQGAWLNSTGRDVVIDEADVSIGGTASSSFQINVGTSTTATTTNTFSLTTSPIWAQLVSSLQVATGSMAQTGATSDFLGTNIESHKSSFPAKLQVPPGYYVLVAANTFCLTDGACNTATSSARGWTNLTTTLFYHYKGSD